MKNIKNRVFQAVVMVFILIGIFIANAQAINLEKNKVLSNKPANKAWTTLFYIDNDYQDGGDLLESIFIDEISSNENLNVVIIQDKLDGPAFYYFIDENHNKVLLSELGEVNMADYQTLRDFINYGKDNYPADRYLLWIVNHGGAWKGACMDDTSNEVAMSMDEIQQALSESGGVNIISFLACLMSSLESVYELRDLVDIYIGSEDLAHISAWNGICGDTNQLLTDIPDLSSEEIAIEIVSYFKEHHNPPANKLTMSAIRTNKVESLANAINELAKYFVTHWIRSYSNVKEAFDNTFLLSDWQSWAEVFEVYDLRGFIENLPNSSKKQAALNAFDEAIITEVHGYDMTETYGLSIFFQAHKSSYQCFKNYKSKELGLDFPKDTCWNEFLFLFILTNLLLKNKQK
jgi:hypothetical protein